MTQILQDIWNGLVPFLTAIVTAIKTPMLWIWGVILTAVVIPANFILDQIDLIVAWVQGQVNALSESISHLHVADVPGYWQIFVGFAAKADAWVPVVLMIEVGMALVALWFVSATIRLGIRCLGAISGG